MELVIAEMKASLGVFSCDHQPELEKIEGLSDFDPSEDDLLTEDLFMVDTRASA